MIFQQYVAALLKPSGLTRDKYVLVISITIQCNASSNLSTMPSGGLEHLDYLWNHNDLWVVQSLFSMRLLYLNEGPLKKQRVFVCSFKFAPIKTIKLNDSLETIESFETTTFIVSAFLT